MSILIKDMKMPKGCFECPFKDIGMSTMTQCLLVAGWVEYANDGYGIPDACPLVELPEKHGRLIDGDVLSFNLDGMMAVSPTGYIHGDMVADMIGDAPTIIEAEEDDR